MAPSVKLKSRVRFGTLKDRDAGRKGEGTAEQHQEWDVKSI
jgi:hypothetical protein